MMRFYLSFWLAGFVTFFCSINAHAQAIYCSQDSEKTILVQGKDVAVTAHLNKLTKKLSSISRKIKKLNSRHSQKLLHTLIQKMQILKRTIKKIKLTASQVNCDKSKRDFSTPTPSPIIPKDYCQGMINVRQFGALGTNSMEAISDIDIQSRRFIGTYKAGDSWDYVGIQEALLKAQNGEAVCVLPGTYNIFRNWNIAAGTSAHVGIVIKSGVSLIGIDSPVLRSPLRLDGTRAVFKISDSPTSIGSHITISGINFEYGYLLFSSTGSDVLRGEDLKIINNNFEGGMVGGGASIADPEIPSSIDGPALNSQQAGFIILISKMNNVLIKGNHFKRDEHGPGRGIGLFRTTNVAITENLLEGHFITGINVAGGKLVGPGQLADSSRNIHTEIDSNIIERTVNKDQLSEDHGIYVVYAKDVFIRNNQISGFSMSDTGGSIKARNGEGYHIENNYLRGSGIFLYNYETNNLGVNYLKNVSVASNIVDQCGIQPQSGGLMIQRAGIFFWSNINTRSSQTVYEENIILSKNAVRDGIIKITNPAQGDAFTLNLNKAISVGGEPSGMHMSDNINGFNDCP